MEVDSEKDIANLKSAFQITKAVTLKLFEENKISTDLFQQEIDTAIKKGNFHFIFISNHLIFKFNFK